MSANRPRGVRLAPLAALAVASSWPRVERLYGGERSHLGLNQAVKIPVGHAN
jgi:hypothetical protein